MFAAMLCKNSVPLKCKLKMAVNQNISVHVFPPYLLPCYAGKLSWCMKFPSHCPPI